jgi:hypothetical protein
MQRRLVVSLVALQCVVAFGYGVQAQDAGSSSGPAYATSTSARRVAAHAADTAAIASKAGEPLTLQLTPRFVSAPGYLRSLVRVARNADNRVLRAAIESEGYYRSSDIQLEGDSAPESHFIDWKGVPAGRYELTVTLLGPGGSTRAARHLDFQVLGLGTGD